MIRKRKNPITKVIFLDHDGVMVLRDGDGDRHLLRNKEYMKSIKGFMI